MGIRTSACGQGKQIVFAPSTQTCTRGLEMTSNKLHWYPDRFMWVMNLTASPQSRIRGGHWPRLPVWGCPGAPNTPGFWTALPGDAAYVSDYQRQYPYRQGQSGVAAVWCMSMPTPTGLESESPLQP